MFFFGGPSRRFHRVDDAAAGARNLLVARALQAQLELVGAVSGIDEMRVAVDQAGRDPGTAHVVLLTRLAAPLAARADPADQAVFYRQDAIQDHPVWRCAAHRREVRVDPGGIVHLVIIAAWNATSPVTRCSPRAGPRTCCCRSRRARSSRSRPGRAVRSRSPARGFRGWRTCTRTRSSARWRGPPARAAPGRGVFLTGPRIC